MSQEGHSPLPRKRWYDRDPVLRRAIEQLRHAPDKYQAQIALNIIKIIVEHQMEEETDIPAEELADRVSGYRRSWDDQRGHRRWYDMQETLSSAIQLLSDCPEDLQKRVIPTIAAMIEKTLEAGESPG